MQTSGETRREIANACFGRMGGAKRYPSMPVRMAMGIASLHPYYKTALCRLNPKTLRRPCERRDPYAAADVVLASWWSAFPQQLATVVMGPCVRRDDDLIHAAAPSSRRFLAKA